MSYSQAHTLAAALSDGHIIAEPTRVGPGLWAVVAFTEQMGEHDEFSRAVTFIAAANG